MAATPHRTERSPHDAHHCETGDCWKDQVYHWVCGGGGSAVVMVVLRWWYCGGVVGWWYGIIVVLIVRIEVEVGVLM